MQSKNYLKFISILYKNFQFTNFQFSSERAKQKSQLLFPNERRKYKSETAFIFNQFTIFQFSNVTSECEKYVYQYSHAGNYDQNGLFFYKSNDFVRV